MVVLDIPDMINSVVILVVGIMVAVVFWKISQLVDALKENIKENKKT
jgi:hypothetical protein